MNEKKANEDNNLCSSKENVEVGKKMSEKMKRKVIISENKPANQQTSDWEKEAEKRRLSEKNTVKNDSAKWKPIKPKPEEVRKQSRGRGGTGSYKIPLEHLNCKGSGTVGVLTKKEQKNKEEGNETITSQLDKIVASQRRLLTRKTKRDDIE